MEPATSAETVPERANEAAHQGVAPVAGGLSSADRRMCRLLRVPLCPEGGVDRRAAENVFSASIAVSAVRCLLTYVALPLLAPVLDLTGGVGPVLGLVVGAVSMAAIVVSMRRFFAAGHRWRWRYAAIGGGVLVLLTVGAVDDVVALLG